MTWKFCLRSLLVLCLPLLPATIARAQSFPEKPISLLCFSSAGASVDLASRVFAQAVSDSIGQRVVVENRTGAGGIVAAMAGKEARPDGYTLLISHIGTHAILQSLQSLPFDPIKDFDHITELFSLSVFVMAPANSPAKTAADVIAMAKANPGGVRYGTSGVGSGSHILGEMWRDTTGASFVHVPYRGGAPMLLDLMAGRLDIGFSTWAAAKEFVKDGKLKFLAIASTKRWSGFPEIPTMAEAGFPGIDQDAWFGLSAPLGTPKPVLQKLHDEFVKASRQPAVMKRMADEGLNVVTNTPDEYVALMKSEAERWGKVIKAANIKPD